MYIHGVKTSFGCEKVGWLPVLNPDSLSRVLFSFVVNILL